MVETTSYFEAYRHVLRALQKIPSQQFPLASYILHLSHDVKPPDYVTATTQFDFTPLLVPIKAGVTSFTQLSIQPNSSDLTNDQTIFRISYDQQNLVNKQYRRVTLLHEALKLALTRKVALIQGPPGMKITVCIVR